MTSFDDLLTKAEAAPRPHRDVEVYLNSDAPDRIAALEQEIADLAPDTRLSDTRPAELRAQIEAIEAEAAESLIVLRFEKMLAEDWAEIIARCPARIDSPVDRYYGYNIHAAGRAAAGVTGSRVDGDTTEKLTESQWDRLFAVMAGREFTRICDVIFELNDYGPQQAIAEAKKVSSAGIDSTSR